MSEFKPRFTNLVSMFQESVRSNGPRPLFGVKKDGQWSWITYAEFAKSVDDFRAALNGLGVSKGDRVAVISNNRLEWAVGAYATYGLGAAYVPMYETQLDKEWEFILKDSGSKVCLVNSDATAARVKKFAPGIAELKHVIAFDGPASDASCYAALLKKGEGKPVAAIAPAPKDVAGFIYTSGTTGNPKGVRLTHLNLSSNVCGMHEIIPFTRDDRTLAFLPWAHVYGGNVELNGLIALGASMAICEAVDKIVESLADVRPTVLFAVPRIWNRIYDGVQKNVASKPKVIQEIFRLGMSGTSKKKAGTALTLLEMLCVPLARKLIFSKIVARMGGRLKYACSGAAALSKDVGEFIDNLGVTVYEGYGMTESSAIATCNCPAGRRIGSVGRPLPGVQIRIDRNAPGSDGESGEIIICGYGVMDGYHNLPEETRQTLTPDGGIRSGDLGRVDKEGFVYITGRVKELYKLENGKYVAPAPLEERITLSPYIAQAMIHGADKPYNVALIVPDIAALKAWAVSSGMESSSTEALLKADGTRKLFEGEIEKYGREFKAFERVKKFILIPEEFSTQNDMLTPTLKLKRRNVLKRYGDRLNTLWQ